MNLIQESNDMVLKFKDADIKDCISIHMTYGIIGIYELFQKLKKLNKIENQENLFKINSLALSVWRYKKNNDIDSIIKLINEGYSIDEPIVEGSKKTIKDVFGEILVDKIDSNTDVIKKDDFIKIISNIVLISDFYKNQRYCQFKYKQLNINNLNELLEIEKTITNHKQLNENIKAKEENKYAVKI